MCWRDSNEEAREETTRRLEMRLENMIERRQRKLKTRPEGKLERKT